MRRLASLAFAITSIAACAAPNGPTGPGPGDDDPMEDPAEEPTETIEFPATDPSSDDPSRRAVLPDCASPLARAMFDATQDVVWRGNVPAEHYATARSTADTSVLIDGPRIFPAFRELIAGARHHVVLQTYVWETGSDPANDILAGLSDLAARRAAEASTLPPVTVRLLIDVSIVGFGSKVEVLPGLATAIEGLQLDPAHVQVELAGFFHIALGNLHAKTVVVDGRDAIVTGANPQVHHDYDSPWRDSGYRFTGDIAVSLLADFDSAWRDGHLWTCGTDATRTVGECIATPPHGPYTIRRPAIAAGTCRPMIVTSRQADADPRSNRTDNTQDQAFLAGFAAARRHIHMQTPNLNDDHAKAALVDAMLRGVRVDVVLSRGFNDLTENLPGQGGDNETNVRRLYDALAAANVPDACDRLRVRWYSRNGVMPVRDNGDYASHVKYTSIDDEVVIVGTANMDTQSWNNAREVNVVVDDPVLAQAWDADLFVADFERGIPVAQCP